MNIGRYEVIEKLGKGGMATVYLASDPYIKRQVAVKVLPKQFTHDPEFRIRFQQEAQVVAALEHAYIVPIYDFGELEDQPFIVMRYLPGGTLTDKLSAGPLQVSEIVPLFQTIAIGLDYAHANGIIHRDIKPGNILFDSEDNAHLSDFGIAKIQEASAVFTGTGNLIGTPAYMSPEQAMGEKGVDGRADIYSLGVVLFQSLSGQLPFTADTPMGVAVAHIQQPIPSLLALRPDLPPGFDGIMQKALNKEPAGRFQSAGEFAEAIYLQTKLFEMGAAPAHETYTRTLNEQALKEQASRDKSDGKPDSTQLSSEAAPASPPQAAAVHAPKKRGPMRLVGVLFILLLAGLAGASFSGLIPNPFAPALPPETAPASSETPFAALPAAADTRQVKASATSAQNPTDSPSQAPPTEALTATSSAPLPEITDGTGTTMVLVPAGPFLMGGSDLNAEPDEKPVHTVILNDYYIDKFEVTNVAYQACVAAGICKPPIKTDSFTRSKYYGIPEYNNYPVVYVDWSMAKNYCEWREARLPTEAEWEKAARGSEDQRFYPWGTSIISCQLANYNGAHGCYNGTTRVDSYEEGKSPYGVYGMAGDVWEWVADWYSETYYQFSPTSNPKGPDTGRSRVLRGGSWNRQEYDIRVSNRNKYGPGYYNFDIGFRCASDLTP